MRVRLTIVLLLVVSLTLSLAMSLAVQAEEQEETEGVPGKYVYVADGKEGLCIIDVSDPAAPAVAGAHETAGTAFAVAAAGDHAYITDTQGGLRVIDVSDPAAPIEEGFLEMAVGVFPGLFASTENYVYVANGSEGLHIIDVSDPAAPTEVGFYDTPDRALDVEVVGDHVYVADNRGGLCIIDVSDPTDLAYVGFYQTPMFVVSVAVAGDYAYSTGSKGLVVINVSDPAKPSEEGRYSRPRAANAIAVSGSFAYVGDDATGLHIVDISDPAAPTEVGHYPDLGWGQPQDLAVVGDYVYVADRVEGLRIFNVSDPATPIEVSVFNTPGSASGVAVAETPAPPTPIATEVRPADEMTMVYVPAGEFLMGSPESFGRVDNHSEHTVYLDAFWIDQTEVTNHQFEIFVEATGYQTDAEKEGLGGVLEGVYIVEPTVEGADWRHPEGPDSTIAERMDLPVVQMSWNDAQAYCRWAGARLPTEAEWEKTARGTDGRRYPWGNEEPSCEYAVVRDVRGYACGQGDKPWPVGSKPAGASPYGALDMTGNVLEWASDRYDGEYYSRSPVSNPPGPDSGSYRIQRGGSWDDYVDKSELRSAFRGSDFPTDRDNLSGFRCAVSESAVAAQAASPIESVLFIGAFETSNLDYYFPMLTDSGDDPIKIAGQRFTNEPSSLKDQWRRGAIGPKPGILVKDIRTGNWDVVVLQQDMTRYSNKAEEFYEYAGKFDEEIKQAGGETVLYMTWRPDPSVTTEDVAAIYNQAGADLGVKVAPVALALQRSLQERPDLPVYQEDSDPWGQFTDPGYYLMMCVLYATIFDRSPVGLSYGMTGGATPPNLFFGWFFEEDVPEEDAAFLQQLAWDTVVEYRAQ